MGGTFPRVEGAAVQVGCCAQQAGQHDRGHDPDQTPDPVEQAGDEEEPAAILVVVGQLGPEAVVRDVAVRPEQVEADVAHAEPNRRGLWPERRVGPEQDHEQYAVGDASREHERAAPPVLGAAAGHFL